jgi:putative phage-type endonuclease
MKSNLILKDTKPMSEKEWLDYRQNGLGASETAAILGVDPYKAAIQVFNEKVYGKIQYEETIPAFMGKYLEDCVAELWQFWDGNQEGMMENYKLKKTVRKCRRVNAFVHNPEYPWLFASPDRIINKNGAQEEAILEIKTISGFAANMWENGIPPMYIIQLQTYLLITGLQYGELAILKDGRYLEVYPFERNENIIAAIIEKTREFWDKVEQARRVKHDEHLVNQIAPEPDGSEAWANYLKEQYKGDKSEREGTLTEFELGKKYLQLCEQIGELETEKTEQSNKIKNLMGETEVLTFGAAGKITWKANVKGVRTFKCSLKNEPSVILASHDSEVNATIVQ